MGLDAPFSLINRNMSSSSLKNMSVDGNILPMPKLQYRWRVRFDAFGGGFAGTGLPGFGSPITANAYEISRPKLIFEDIPLFMYNTLMYMPGRPHWDPITIKIKDDSKNKVADEIAQQIRKVLDFQDVDPGINFASIGSSLLGNDFKFYTYIDMTDGGNTVLEKWKLTGCYIQSVDYGPMSYSSNEVTSLSMVIRFDNMQQFTGKNEWNLEKEIAPIDTVDSDT
jgi:hypothetical protein